MAYNIRKGWPDDSAIDEQFSLKASDTTVPGMVFKIKATGLAEVATYATGGADAGELAFFCFDADTITNKVMGIISACVIEMDSTHYTAGAYAPNVKVTASAGKILVHPGDSMPVLGRVLAYDATSGILRVLWTSNC